MVSGIYECPYFEQVAASSGQKYYWLFSFTNNKQQVTAWVTMMISFYDACLIKLVFE